MTVFSLTQLFFWNINSICFTFNKINNNNTCCINWKDLSDMMWRILSSEQLYFLKVHVHVAVINAGKIQDSPRCQDPYLKIQDWELSNTYKTSITCTCSDSSQRLTRFQNWIKSFQDPNVFTMMDKSPWNTDVMPPIMCFTKEGWKSTAILLKICCFSPFPHPMQCWNSRKIAVTCVQHCSLLMTSIVG